MGMWSNIRSFPLSVWFILGNEFCERFSFYGMRTILMIYLMDEHKLQLATARAITHAFNAIAYLTPVIGAMVADSWLGKFKVILYVSILYVIGHGLLSFGSTPFTPPEVGHAIDYLGLLVIALGTGGIKPCVSAFGADQIPIHKEEARAAYFSYFYIAINTGSLISTALTPQIRDISCGGKEDCYPIAFGIPGILMFVALLLFLAGSYWYVKYPPAGTNVIFKVIGCICLAIRRKFCGAPRPSVEVAKEEGSQRSRESLSEARASAGKESRPKSYKERLDNHEKLLETTRESMKQRQKWLDLATPNYTEMEIWGAKSFLSVVWVLWPMIFFWFLYDQQTTTWVNQGTLMDGRIGPFYISAETMQMLNPLFIIICVPMCRYVIYPLLEKFVRMTDLRKMGVGMLLSGFSFFMAASLQLIIDPSLEPMPSDGHTFVRTLNISAPITLYNHDGKKFNIIADRQELPFGKYWSNRAPFLDNDPKALMINSSASPLEYILFQEQNRVSYVNYSLLRDDLTLGQTKIIFFPEDGLDLSNTTRGWHYYVEEEVKTSYEMIVPGGSFLMKHMLFDTQSFTIHLGTNCSRGRNPCQYNVTVPNDAAPIYVLRITNSTQPQLIQVVSPRKVHVMWQVPQLFVISFGEAFLSVTGLEFAYSQSPPAMKSVMQAIWTLTVSFGNFLEMALSSVHPFDNKPALEMFVYGAIIHVVFVLYALIAWTYKYVEAFPSDDAFRRMIEEDVVDEEKEKEVTMGSKEVSKGSKEVSKGSKEVSKGSKEVSKGSKEVSKGSKDDVDQDHEEEAQRAEADSQPPGSSDLRDEEKVEGSGSKREKSSASK